MGYGTLKPYARRALTLLLLGILAPPRGLYAQDLPAPEKSRLLRDLKEVPTQIAEQDFQSALRTLEGALPIVRNLMEGQPNMRIVYATGLYMKGVCQLELESYGDASETFTGFLRQFPTHPNTLKARLLLGECYLYEENWPGIVQAVSIVVDSRSASFLELEMANQLLARAYLNLEQYQNAKRPLGWLYQNARETDVRHSAAADLAISMVRLGEFTDLYRVMPLLYQTDAKYDINLNLLLLEEGDDFLRDDRPDLALLLYRMVVPYSELEGEVLRRRAVVATRLRNLQEAGAGGAVQSETIRRLERRLEEIDLDKEDLAAYPDYDLELRIRLADVYYALERWEEAIQLYLSIHRIDPGHDLAERAMYSAYMTAFYAEEKDRAYRIALRYMEAYPGGEFWDDVTLHAAGLLITLERWFETEEIIDRALEESPDHVALDNMIYMRGYAEFQQSKIQEAIASMATVIREHPQSPFLLNAEYWKALGHLFEQEYEDARDGFRIIVDRGRGGPLREDGYYRLGVSYYGLGDFAASKRTLDGFLEEYPDSILASEALAMIGDILASDGRLDEAIANYRQAVDRAVNMVQADYATFQQARTLELEQKWEEILELFRDYNQRFGEEEANFTESTYWMGNALKQLGRDVEALNLFYDAIVTHGNKPEAYGIDFILRDLVREINESKGSETLALDMRERLNKEIQRAAEEQLTTLLLRLDALQYRTTDNENLKQSIRDRLIDEDKIEPAAPITLELMGELGREVERPEFTRKVYEHFLERYEDSDLILGALLGLAENRVEEGRYREAEDLLRSVGDRFPMLPQTAEARLRLGDVQRLRGNHEEAVETYTLILSVKEWRGELWPEALLRIGDTHAELEQWEKAFGFYQRVYVMYIGYPEQAAKAYVRSAEMKQKLGDTAEARATLEEMLNQPELARQPVAREARAMIMRMP